MGALVAGGFTILICLFIGLIITIIGLFFGNIIVFDSIALGILSGVLASELWSLHPAFCLLIGIAMFIGVMFLQKTKIGFWIVAVVLSLLWALIFSSLAYEISQKDMVWTYVVFGLGLLLMMGLHLRARKRIV